MQLKQLKYFMAVLEHGSFSNAAAELGRTQQAISKAVHNLEEIVGVRLLDRNARVATPTVFGELLLVHARNVDLELRSFRERVAEMLGTDKGQVTVGASATAAGLLLADAVSMLQSRQPDIRVTVKAGIYQDLLPNLLRGELDICVGVETVDANIEGLVREVLCRERFCVVASAQHPLAGQASVRHQQLLEHPWVLGQKLGSVEEAFVESFDTLGLGRPDAAIETNSTEFLREILLRDQHLCLLPADLFADEIAQGRMVRLPVTQFDWSASISLYYRRGTAPGNATVALIDALHVASRQHERNSS
ncbi:MAG: LysR family transcriptional regulator [Gammaproteobacteria bacterium]|nr:LysR family transcriptional regulator [Gammaproteobacteria bacterium]